MLCSRDTKGAIAQAEYSKSPQAGRCHETVRKLRPDGHAHAKCQHIQTSPDSPASSMRCCGSAGSTVSCEQGHLPEAGSTSRFLKPLEERPFVEQRDSGPAKHHVYVEMRARFIIYLNLSFPGNKHPEATSSLPQECGPSPSWGPAPFLQEALLLH